MSEVGDCYYGSDGFRTTALYERLKKEGGGRGLIAVNLLRSCKNSERAKGYKSRRSVGAAYGTKDWALGQLVDALILHGGAAGFEWGWGYDAKAVAYENVLYVEVPGCGQVSFHMSHRLAGPDHGKPWDGVRGVAAARVIRYAETVLGIQPKQEEENVARPDRPEGEGAPRDAGGEVREAEARQAALDL